MGPSHVSRHLKMLGMELADYVHELTETYNDVVEDEDGRRHKLRVPPLLDQLWTSDVPVSLIDGGQRPGFGSKPAARLDALDTAARIDLEAEHWLYRLGSKPRNASSTVMVRQLHGLVPNASPRHRREVTSAIRTWWIWARIVSGWDAAAWTPDVTCPQCGKSNTVKIRLAERFAACVNDECRITWDADTIGLLALHIKTETYDKRDSAWRLVGPCWCPVPEPDVANLRRMCPRCGSARCHRAVAMGRLDTLRINRGA